jgi:hypothetical protein
MDTESGPGRPWLAFFPPTAVGLLLVGQLLTPQGLDQPIRSTSGAADQLAKAAGAATRLYVASTLIILGVGLLAAAFVAIASLTGHRRGAAVGAVAAALAGVSCLCGLVVNSLVNLNVAGTADAAVPRDAAASVLAAVNTGPVPTAFLVTYVAGLALASVLMAVALWRAGTVERWLAALFPVCLLVGSLAPPGVVGALLSVPFAVVMVLLALRLRRAEVPGFGLTAVPA